MTLRSLATCGFNSPMVSKPRFEVIQASACPKNTGNTTREGLTSVVTEAKNRSLRSKCSSSSRVASQAVATHIFGAFNMVSLSPRRSARRWTPPVRFASRRYCSAPSVSAMICRGSNMSAICRYSATFSATASNWPARARRRISSVVSNTFGEISTARFKSCDMRLSQICIAALASLIFTSETRLSETAKRMGTPASAAIV